MGLPEHTSNFSSSSFRCSQQEKLSLSNWYSQGTSRPILHQLSLLVSRWLWPFHCWVVRTFFFFFAPATDTAFGSFILLGSAWVYKSLPWFPLSHILVISPKERVYLYNLLWHFSYSSAHLWFDVISFEIFEIFKNLDSCTVWCKSVEENVLCGILDFAVIFVLA